MIRACIDISTIKVRGIAGGLICEFLQPLHEVCPTCAKWVFCFAGNVVIDHRKVQTSEVKQALQAVIEVFGQRITFLSNHEIADFTVVFTCQKLPMLGWLNRLRVTFLTTNTIAAS